MNSEYTVSSRRIHQLGDGITSFLEWTVAACLAVILTITILLVMLRYIFNTHIKGANELASYLFVYMTALGAPAAVFRSDHIALSVLVKRLPQTWRRFSDILVQLLIIVMNAVILSYSFAWIRGVGSFVSPVLRIPNRFIQVSVPIGCSATIVISTINILRVAVEGEIVTTGADRAGLAD